MTYDGDKADPLNGSGNPSLQEIDAILYGGVPETTSGRVVARPILLESIFPDVTQPRRIVPAAARRGWDGTPEGIPPMLERWQVLCRRYLNEGESLNAQGILAGEHIINVNLEYAHPVVAGFVELIDLAMNIRDKGLNNPITVARAKAPLEVFVIHTGERRYMAHWLLHLTIGGYGKIAAIEREADPFSQIAENTQRSDMNAISMARSLAVLIMATRRDEMEFRPFHEMVTEEGCDKPFYAQVADVNVKRGMSDSVKNALNIQSSTRIGQYKQLLKLRDDIWMAADDENWSEGRLRELMRLPDDLQTRALENRWTAARIIEEIERFSGDNSTRVGLSPSESAPDRISARFGGDYSNATQTPSNAPEGGYRTSIGERMGMYEKPSPPTPLPEGEGSEEHGVRPVITHFSTVEEWKASGYEYCPDPREFEIDETWTEEDEIIAAEAAAWNAQYDAGVVLDQTPLCLNYGAMDLLDDLTSVAKGIDDRKGARVLVELRKRSTESIRVWLLANMQDVDEYEKKLTAEAEQIDGLLNDLREQLYRYLEHLLDVAKRVREEMG